MNNNIYKMFQLNDYFITKYQYNQFLINNYKSFINNEIWLYNFNNLNYQIIRITIFSSKEFIYDKERIEIYLDYLKKASKNDNLKFLDIHINSDEYSKDDEEYDFINLDENYCAGVSLNEIFPGIKSVIHFSADSKKEIRRRIDNINKAINSRTHKKIQIKDFYITFILFVICVINYMINLYLSTSYETSSVLVLLGADYKTFTLCLKEFYRLFSYIFVHGSLIHLSCNMLSLLTIGSYIEKKYGKIKYLIIVVFCAICSGLTQGAFVDNGICIGISGVIYGMLLIYIVDIVKINPSNIKRIMPTIIVNIFLNFVSNVAWTAHLGGLIAGVAIYNFIQDNKNVYSLAVSLLLIVCLFTKYNTTKNNITYFSGTDKNIVELYYQLGFKDHARDLSIRLIKLYSK